jgi:hypothetical protein
LANDPAAVSSRRNVMKRSILIAAAVSIAAISGAALSQSGTGGSSGTGASQTGAGSGSVLTARLEDAAAITPEGQGKAVVTSRLTELANPLASAAQEVEIITQATAAIVQLR